jgi:hypothetical protein
VLLQKSKIKAVVVVVGRLARLEQLKAYISLKQAKKLISANNNWLTVPRNLEIMVAMEASWTMLFNT